MVLFWIVFCVLSFRNLYSFPCVFRLPVSYSMLYIVLEALWFSTRNLRSPDQQTSRGRRNERTQGCVQIRKVQSGGVWHHSTTFTYLYCCSDWMVIPQSHSIFRKYTTVPTYGTLCHQIYTEILWAMNCHISRFSFQKRATQASNWSIGPLHHWLPDLVIRPEWVSMVGLCKEKIGCPSLSLLTVYIA